jgi:tetratricopeptide (TPR) repeat protein
VVGVAVVAAAGGWWWANRVPVPDSPLPDLAAVTDPVIRDDVTAARRAVEQAPRQAAAWGEYGMVLRAYLYHPEADLCFRTAAALDPSDGRWPYLLGVHLAEADPAAAVEPLRQAAERSVPEAARETVRLRYVEALLAAGRPADAAAALGPEPPKSPRGRLAAARAAAATGDDRRALEFLVDLANHPSAGRAALTLQSQIYLKQGRTGYASQTSQKAAAAVDRGWPDPIAEEIGRRNHTRGGLLDEAARLLREGRPADAEAILRPLTVGATDARPLVGLAEARLARGDRDGAFRALTDAARIEPRNVVVNYQLGSARFEAGEALWSAGRRAEAKQSFREAVERFDAVLAADPNFGKAILLKGVALERFLGKADDGMALLRQFVQARPEVAEGHLLLGQALAAVGRRGEALASLRRAAELSPAEDHRAAQAIAGLDTSPVK